jgi:hypothetical protein
MADTDRLARLTQKINELQAVIKEVSLGSALGERLAFSAGSCTDGCTVGCTDLCTHGCTGKGCTEEPGDGDVILTALQGLRDQAAERQ